MKQKQLISVISPCYNESDNVEEMYNRVTKILSNYPNYNFEYLFIDNSSSDGTVEKLKDIAQTDNRLKIIVNTRNFGQIRSPYWGLIQAQGDATIYLASDLQDPPELIPQFIHAWENGYKIALAVKPKSDCNILMHTLRRAYYVILNSISDVQLINNATGFGLYDKEVLDNLRKINDPYPYLRGLIAELGYPIKQIEFNQPRRLRGISKNNFYTLYDIAALGVVSHSLVPIRLAILSGFLLGALSFIGAILIFVLKLIFWERFPLGLAPIGIITFFLFGVILFFLGILGEYIGSIQTFLKNRPIVVEKERINF